MRNYCRFIIVALLVSFTFVFNSIAFADCSATACVGKIMRLYSDNAGNVLIGTDGDERVLDCTSPADVYITLPNTDPNFDRKYAMLLTAMTLDQAVTIRAITGSTNCSVGYIAIDSVTP